jgi:hypothetical protein
MRHFNTVDACTYLSSTSLERNAGNYVSEAETIGQEAHDFDNRFSLITECYTEAKERCPMESGDEIVTWLSLQRLAPTEWLDDWKGMYRGM